jgi:hypothetical protein
MASYTAALALVCDRLCANSMSDAQTTGRANARRLITHLAAAGLARAILNDTPFPAPALICWHAQRR